MTFLLTNTDRLRHAVADFTVPGQVDRRFIIDPGDCLAIHLPDGAQLQSASPCVQVGTITHHEEEMEF